MQTTAVRLISCWELPEHSRKEPVLDSRIGKAGWSRKPALTCPWGGLGEMEADLGKDNDI